MKTTTCFNCRLVTQYRFRLRLLDLQNGRRKSSSLSQPQNHGSWYWDTKTPTNENLAAASHFFSHHKPTRLWTGESWKASEIWRSSRSPTAQKVLIPEVVFLGRSNVGKSTLINALVLTDLNRVSAKPGMTEVMAAWALAAKDADGGAIKGWGGDMTPKITLVDMPGYGHGSRSEWGDQIVSYMSKRRNLRRAFLLVDSVHGVMAADRHMLEIFQKLGVPYQLVATKCDRLDATMSEESIRGSLEKMKTMTTSDKSALMLGEIIAVGNLQEGASTKPKQAFGIRNLQWAILQATNLEWFAMDRAAEHKVVDKKSAVRPQASIGVELANIIDILPKETQATDPISPAQQTLSASVSSETALPNLSLQEFMREILGPGHEQGASSSQQGVSQRPSSPAREVDLNPSKVRNTSVNESIEDMRQQLASAYKNLPIKSPTQVVARNLSGSWTSGPYDQAAPPRQDRSQALARTQARSKQLPYALGRTTKQSPSLTRAQTRTETPPATLKFNGQTGQSPASTQSPSTLSGKGVARGFDAFEAMFAEPPKPSQTQGRGGRQSSRGGGRSSSQKQISQTRSPMQNQSVRRPVIVGKGVSKGLDAFEAMFAEPESQKRTKSKRR